jgi:hypothetical protein
MPYDQSLFIRGDSKCDIRRFEVSGIKIKEKIHG